MLPYPPSANRYWRHFRGRTVRSSEADKYRGAVSYYARVAGLTARLSGPVRVRVTLHPKLTKKGDASKTRLDLDNCAKVLLDALQGIAFAHATWTASRCSTPRTRTATRPPGT